MRFKNWLLTTLNIMAQQIPVGLGIGFSFHLTCLLIPETIEDSFHKDVIKGLCPPHPLY